MNPKISVLIAVILVATMVTAGCLGGDDETNGSSKPAPLETEQGTITPAGNWADTGVNANHTILCEGPVTYMEIIVDLQDSDDQHAASDQGSAPDQVNVTVSNGNTTQSQMAFTGSSTTFKFPTPGKSLADGETMPNAWTVDILHLPGQIGTPIRLGLLFNNIDQGCTWAVTGKYTYVIEEAPVF